MVVEKNALRTNLAKMNSESETLVPVAPKPVTGGRSIHTLGGHDTLLRLELLVPQCTSRPLIQALVLASLTVLASPATATQSDPTDVKLLVGILGFLVGVVGAIIGAIGLLAATQRRIQMDNVVQERAKWRDKIRRLTSEVHEAMMKGDPDKRRKSLLKLKVKFHVVLNPYDCDDKKILNSIADAYECECGHSCKCAKERKKRSDEFSERISCLLKHDWERAKEEVKHPILQWWTPERRDQESNCKRNPQAPTAPPETCCSQKTRRSLGECFRPKNSRCRLCKVVWTAIVLLATPPLAYCYFLYLALVF